MYDLWFTLGSAIMEPEFLTAAARTAPPEFRPLRRKISEEPPATHVPDPFVSRFAGLLEETSNRAFRRELRKGLVGLAQSGKIQSPPPVSLYTAGRLTQFIRFESLQFLEPVDGVIAKAHDAFANATKTCGHGGQFPAGFTAFLGLCLIDDGMCLLHNSGLAPLHKSRRDVGLFSIPPDELDIHLEEFGLPRDPTHPDRCVLRLFIEESRSAAQILLGGDTEDPWDYGCPDWQLYWSPQSDRAII